MKTILRLCFIAGLISALNACAAANDPEKPRTSEDIINHAQQILASPILPPYNPRHRTMAEQTANDLRSPLNNLIEEARAAGDYQTMVELAEMQEQARRERIQIEEAPGRRARIAELNQAMRGW